MPNHRLGVLGDNGVLLPVDDAANALDARLWLAGQPYADRSETAKAYRDRDAFLSDLDKLGIAWKFQSLAGHQVLVLSYDGFDAPHIEMVPVVAHWFD